MRVTRHPSNGLGAVRCGPWHVETEPGAPVIASACGHLLIEGLVDRFDGRPFTVNARATASLDAIRDATDLVTRAEGIYAAVVVNKETRRLEVCRSAPASLDLYVPAALEGDVLATTDPAELPGRGYDGVALACVLSEGYCPDGWTIHAGIRRLRHTEVLDIGADRARIDRRPPEPVAIVEAPPLEEYHQTLRDAILTRASDAGNWVECSGGWDSTAVLATLHGAGCRGVRPVTVEIHLADGTVFNPYEVERARAAASHYGLPLELVRYDLGSDVLPDRVRGNARVMRTHGVFELQALWRPLMYADVARQAAGGESCFNSLFSDSIHNFGFSQYVTVAEQSYPFREFLDKMATSQYGPTFYRQVVAGNFADDFIPRMFRWHSGLPPSALYEPASHPSGRVAQYLLSFVYGRDRRVPFSRPAVHDVLTSRGRDDFDAHLVDQYVGPVRDRVEPGTLYFWLIQLYQQFYLQGAERAQVVHSLRGGAVRPAMPFLDRALLRYLAAMPEDYGRGVGSWANTKYPLKHYAEHCVDWPGQALDAVPFHSYIVETPGGRRVNVTHETLYQSTLARDLFAKIRPETVDDYFSGDLFDLGALRALVASRHDTSPVKRRLMLFLMAMTEA